MGKYGKTHPADAPLLLAIRCVLLPPQHPAASSFAKATEDKSAATHNTAREPRRSATEPGGCGGSLYGAILRLGAFFIALFAVFVNKLYAFEEVFVGA